MTPAPATGETAGEKISPADVRRAVRRVLLAACAVSGGLNLLMLVPAFYMYQVFDRVLSTQHLETLWALTAIALLGLVLMGALDAARGAVGVRLGAWLDATLAGPLLRATVHGANLTGATRGAQALRDLATVRGVFGGAVWPLLDAPWTPFFFILTFLIHPLLGWIGVIGGVILLGLAAANELITRRAIQNSGAAAITAINEADAAVRNADAMLAMGMLPRWLAAWEGKREAAAAPQGRAAFRSGMLGAVAKVARLALQVALLGFGAWLAVKNEISGGAMIAASIIVARALAPFEQAIASWRGLVAAQSAWGRLAALLDAAPAIGQPIRLPRPKGALVLDKVVYAPPGAREPILRQVSFALQGGELLVMIGPSGAGKTTLARLIVGSLVPNGGAVRLDGGAIANWAPDDRARHVGYLPQDVELCNGTVRENIARFGEAADADVVAAAQLAGAHETILGLPQGYGTPIGPAGMPLSGGQRQRVGLARAVFGDARLVVLDEPNANLDPEGEAALAEALKRLKERAVTVVCITQRLGLLGAADRILMLRQGLVEGFGPPAEVLGRAGRPAPADPRRQHLTVASPPPAASTESA